MSNLYDPHYLVPDELEYELNFYGVVNYNGLPRNKARIIKLRREEQRHLATNERESPWDIDIDLASARASMNSIRRILQDSYDSNLDYRQYYHRLRHLEARAGRMRGGADHVAAITELRAAIQQQIDGVIAIVQDVQSRPIDATSSTVFTYDGGRSSTTSDGGDEQPSAATNATLISASYQARQAANLNPAVGAANQTAGRFVIAPATSNASGEASSRPDGENATGIGQVCTNNNSYDALEGTSQMHSTAVHASQVENGRSRNHSSDRAGDVRLEDAESDEGDGARGGMPGPPRLTVNGPSASLLSPIFPNGPIIQPQAVRAVDSDGIPLLPVPKLQRTWAEELVEDQVSDGQRDVGVAMRQVASGAIPKQPVVANAARMEEGPSSMRQPRSNERPPDRNESRDFLDDYYQAVRRQPLRPIAPTRQPMASTSNTNDVNRAVPPVSSQAGNVANEAKSRGPRIEIYQSPGELPHRQMPVRRPRIQPANTQVSDELLQRVPQNEPVQSRAPGRPNRQSAIPLEGEPPRYQSDPRYPRSMQYGLQRDFDDMNIERASMDPGHRTPAATFRDASDDRRYADERRYQQHHRHTDQQYGPRSAAIDDEKEVRRDRREYPFDERYASVGARPTWSHERRDDAVQPPPRRTVAGNANGARFENIDNNGYRRDNGINDWRSSANVPSEPYAANVRSGYPLDSWRDRRVGGEFPSDGGLRQYDQRDRRRETPSDFYRGSERRPNDYIDLGRRHYDDFQREGDARRYADPRRDDEERYYDRLRRDHDLHRFDDYLRNENERRFDRRFDTEGDAATQRSSVQSQNVRFIPVNKWKISFSGNANSDGRDSSIHEFLAQVEMFRRSEGVSERDLVRQAIHLLRGPALAWYETVYYTIYTWADFVVALKRKFLPDNYSYVLLAEIESRRQSQKEPVGLYISEMERKFRALPNPMPESHRVYIIRKNLLPVYRDALAPWPVRDVVHLEELCKRIECTVIAPSTSAHMSGANVRTHHERRYRSNVAAAAAAARDSSESASDDGHDSDCSEASVDAVAARMNRTANKARGNPHRSKRPSDERDRASDAYKERMTCYNCDEKGHYWRDCEKPRERKFCFGCGKRDAMIDDGHECPYAKNSTKGSRSPAEPKSSHH